MPSSVAVNINLFIDGVPDAPPIPMACKEALFILGSVKVPPPGFGASFFFPPPWLVYNADSKKRDRYIHNYIRIRDICLRRQFSEQFINLAKRTEYWREAIKGEYKHIRGVDENMTSAAIVAMNDTLPISLSNTSTLSSKRIPRKVIRVMARTEFGCNGELEPWNDSMVVCWQGTEVRYGDIGRLKRLREEVQFELYELNWRAELLALDIKVTQDDTNSIDHVAKRKEKVGRLWRDNSNGVILFPDRSQDYFNVWSDAMNNVTNSRIALNNLYAILQDWPSFPPGIRGLPAMTLTSIQLHHLKKELFCFYAKTFYTHYFRLPILPRSLSA